MRRASRVGLSRVGRVAVGGGARRKSTFASALSQKIKDDTEKLHEDVLQPINARLLGPLERRPFTEGVPLPVVLLLGNHSSGKSSFINYVLGRKFGRLASRRLTTASLSLLASRTRIVTERPLSATPASASRHCVRSGRRS